MEDVQDGIKVSIQDGVTEDPATADVDVAHKSFGGIIQISTLISNPEITSAVRGNTNSKISGTITSSVSGVVT